MIEHVSGDMDLENLTLNDLLDLAHAALTSELYDQFLSVAMFTQDLNNPNTKPQVDFSLEYCYLLYLLGEHPEFEEQYYQFVTRACFAEFMEWYEYIVKHLFNDDVQEEFDLTPSNIHQWWAYRITDHHTFMRHLPEAVEIGNKMKNFFNQRRRLSTVDEDYFESDHAQVILDTIQLLRYNDKGGIVDQIDTDIFLLMFEVFGWDNTHSYHIIQFLYNNRNTING